MSPDDHARLVHQWVDRRVCIRSGQAVLERFDGLEGVVKAVNWSGRCLVQFDNGQDIGWYDIAPSELRLIAAATSTEGDASA